MFFPRECVEEEDDEFPIFEYAEPWPDLENGDWKDLYILTGDECKSSVGAIVEQITSIVGAIEQKAAPTARSGPAAERPRMQRRKSK